MKDRVYFARKRIKILKDFLSTQIFQSDVLVFHMHVLSNMGFRPKSPLVRPGSFFNLVLRMPLIRTDTSLLAA